MQCPGTGLNWPLHQDRKARTGTPESRAAITWTNASFYPSVRAGNNVTTFKCYKEAEALSGWLLYVEQGYKGDL